MRSVRLPPPPRAPAGDATGDARRGRLARCGCRSDGGCRPCPSRCRWRRNRRRERTRRVFDWADARRGRDRHRLAPAARADRGRRPRALGRAPAARRAWPRIVAELGSEGVDADRARARGATRCDGRSRARLAIRAGAGCSIRRTRTRTANGRWPARTRGASCTSCSIAASSRAATATSSISRPARTWAAIRRHSSQQEFERYRPQLARYARIVRAIDPRPVRIALYHPLVEDGWQEHRLPELTRAAARSPAGGRSGELR